MITKDQQLKRISKHLKQLSDENYYGEVTVKMEAGNIVHLRYVKNEKIENLDEGAVNATATGGSC